MLRLHGFGALWGNQTAVQLKAFAHARTYASTHPSVRAGKRRRSRVVQTEEDLSETTLEQQQDRTRKSSPSRPADVDDVPVAFRFNASRSRSLTEPPDTLKSENIVLRQLLGYGGGVKTRPPKFGLRRPGTKLSDSEMKDFLFVGLDVDTLQNGKILTNQQLNFGLSILDTRDLKEALSTSRFKVKDCSHLITSYQFATGTAEYCEWARDWFLFGTAESGTIEELKPRLASLIDADRDIVLVVHGSENDLKAIQQIDPNFVDRSLYTIFTHSMAMFPLQLKRTLSLKRLLQKLQIPFSPYCLHAAGNDARLCLQALLMLAVRDAELLSSPGGALMQLLREVAQHPIPPTAVDMFLETRLQATRLTPPEALDMLHEARTHAVELGSEAEWATKQLRWKAEWEAKMLRRKAELDAALEATKLSKKVRRKAGTSRGIATSEADVLRIKAGWEAARNKMMVRIRGKLRPRLSTWLGTRKTRTSTI